MKGGKYMKRIEGINFIRIFCMITILLFHSKLHFGFNTKLIVLDEFVSIGAVAIVGFFMLSGFCLRVNVKSSAPH